MADRGGVRTKDNKFIMVTDTLCAYSATRLNFSAAVEMLSSDDHRTIRIPGL